MVEKCATKSGKIFSTEKFHIPCNKKWLNNVPLKVSFFQVAVNETVKHCYRPLVSDCDVEGMIIALVIVLNVVVVVVVIEGIIIAIVINVVVVVC